MKPLRSLHHNQWKSTGAIFLFLLVAFIVPSFAAEAQKAQGPERHLLYVATPGIRNYLEYGGHGILVFDIDNGHRFVKRIPSAGLDEQGKPRNVKGICASSANKRLYVSTPRTLMSFDLVTEKLVWEKPYEGGCDRMSISPDSKYLYVPSFEAAHWHVVDAMSGEVVKTLVPNSGAHNTVYGPNGKEVYLGGLKSPLLWIADTKDHTLGRSVGPFSASIRPFTVNGSQTLCFVNINELLGFEVGDLRTGKKLYRVEVTGFEKGTVKRHGCPSHGIGLTEDETELWLTDAANSRMHIFDATVMPPKQIESIQLRDQPGWISFGIGGRYAYPSTGDVVEIATRKIVAGLKDETGQDVQSEKLLQIDFAGSEPIRASNQFGVGKATKPARRASASSK
jgi:DNA-binding beta-propeller fold protein YncE